MSSSEEMYVANQTVGLSDLIAVSDIKTDEQLLAIANAHGSAGYTVDAFEAEYPTIDSSKVFAVKSESAGHGHFYWDKEKHILFPLFLYGDNFVPIGDDNDTLEKAIAAGIENFNECKARGNYTPMLITLNGYLSMQYLDDICRHAGELCVKNLFPQFLSTYHHADYGAEMLSDEAWNAIAASMPDEQKAKVAKQLENQPEQMTVYRGGGRASSHIDNSTSWTLEAGVAGFFATRLERERPVIVQAVINKSDVLNYDEVEQEILIAPNAPRTILNTWVLYGIQWLNDVHEDAGKMYQRIFANPERLATLDRLSGGDKAIKQHVCCQIFIAACLLLDSDVPEMMRDGLLRRIADAFIWRLAAGENCIACKRAERQYRNHASEQSNLVSVILKSLTADEETGKKLFDSTKFENESYPKKAYDFFFDALALGRVSEEMYAVDITKLRTEEATHMLLIALLTAENLEPVE